MFPSVVTYSICSGTLTVMPDTFGPGILLAGRSYEMRFRKLKSLSASSTTTPDWLSVPLSPGVAIYTRWRSGGAASRGGRALFWALTYVAETRATAHTAANFAILTFCMTAPVVPDDTPGRAPRAQELLRVVHADARRPRAWTPSTSRLFVPYASLEISTTLE